MSSLPDKNLDKHPVRDGSNTQSWKASKKIFTQTAPSASRNKDAKAAFPEEVLIPPPNPTTNFEAVIPPDNPNCTTITQAGGLIAITNPKKPNVKLCSKRGCNGIGYLQIAPNARGHHAEIYYCKEHYDGHIAGERKRAGKKRAVLFLKTVTEKGWPKAKSGWTQTDLVKRVEDPIRCFLDVSDYAVFTFSSNFAYQLLSLRSMEKCNSMDAMPGWVNISNPIVGRDGLGKYKITTSTEDWKDLPGKHFAGGGFRNNMHMHVINMIMRAARSFLPGDYDPKHYTEKVGLVCTIRPYVQVPHQDFNRGTEARGAIVHLPLCDEGAYLYVWKSKRNQTPKEHQLLHIPFGSMLVLDGDVWHGGIVGSPGNVRFHAAILPIVDTTVSDQLVYRPGCKQWYRDIKFEPLLAINVLPEDHWEEIKKIILYIKHTFFVPDSLFAPLSISK